MTDAEGMASITGPGLLGPVGPALAVVDAEGKVIGWSQAAQRLLGHQAAEVMGKPVAQLLASPGDPSQAMAFAERSRAQGGWAGLATVRRHDNRRLRLDVRISPLTGAGGRTDWLVTATELAEAAGREPGTVDNSLLESLFIRSPVGVTVWDTELRCSWINETQERGDGVPRARRLGRVPAEALPGLDAGTFETTMRRVLQSGIAVTDQEYLTRPERGQGQERTISVSFFRLDDADGRALGVCSLSVDITGSRPARERLILLSEASTRIGSTLDVIDTAQELADFAVPLVADFVAIDLAESVPRGEEPLARLGPLKGSAPVFRRASGKSIHEGNSEFLWARGDQVFVPHNSPFIWALSSGRSHLEPHLDASPGTWLDQDPARVRVIRESGMHSLMILPIHARGSVLGTAAFLRTDNPAPFEEEDLLLAEELVSRAALSLDNARRYTREHAAALALQRNLLPHALSGGTAAEVASRYLPANLQDGVGGDWFDVIPLSGARVALVVGDVVGHGIKAAATMGRLRTAVHTLADLDLSPEELLAHLDDAVLRLAKEDSDAQNPPVSVLGATCLYAVYDPVSQVCTMASAGHPPPAVLGPDGTVTFPELPTGAPLGLGLLSFESAEIQLPEGSVIALYTDGLIDTPTHDLDAGMHRLSTALASGGHTLEDLCTEVVSALPATAPSDDVALLLARTRTLDPGQIASWELPNDPARVSEARLLTSRQLEQWGLHELTSTTQLLVSELVTNAIRHAGGPIRLRLIRHQVLVCEVSDTSNSSPRLRHARTTDEGGRGLFLVAQLSQRWGTRYTADGKLIWAEQDLPASVGSGPPRLSTEAPESRPHGGQGTRGRTPNPSD